MEISILFIPEVSNPQFSLLKSALINNGCNVCSDLNEFWHPSTEYDIMHIQCPEFLYGFVSSKCKYRQKIIDQKTVSQLKYFEKNGTKIIWTAFNLKGHEQKYYGENNLVYYELSKLCHAIITMGASYHKLLKTIYPAIKDKPIVIIPHGNFIDTYPNNISRSVARNKLNIEDNKIVILNFGLQRKYKDIYFIYKSFKASYKKNNSIRLLIAGHPWGIKKKLFFIFLRMFHSNIIVEPRFIKNNEVQLFFNASDIAIFAFKNMITSGSIPLAQSFGLPVIAPNIGCFPDIVPKSLGFLYNQNDVDNCVETINIAVQHDIKKMGILAKNMQKSTSWNSIGEKTKLLYESVLT